MFNTEEESIPTSDTTLDLRDKLLSQLERKMPSNWLTKQCIRVYVSITKRVMAINAWYRG